MQKPAPSETGNTPKKSPYNVRHKARKRATQALYRWSMTHEPTERLIEDFLEIQKKTSKSGLAYFTNIVTQCIENQEILCEKIVAYSAIPLEKLDPIAKIILWIAIHELMHQTKIPWRVILDEAIEQAKIFGPEQSFKFINGVLDKAVKDIRPDRK